MTVDPQDERRFASVQDVRSRLAATGYLVDDAIATTVFLADRLAKPLLVEGPAGVGKTHLAKAVAEATDADLVRLQCYEGLDEARALYEWNYKKQLLRIQASAAVGPEFIPDEDPTGAPREGTETAPAGTPTWSQLHDDVFGEEFLLPRPLLTAIRSPRPTVLLIDETDKADVEMEGLLLEVLSDFQVSIPERDQGAVGGPEAALPVPAHGLPGPRARAGDRPDPRAGRRARARRPGCPRRPRAAHP